MLLFANLSSCLDLFLAVRGLFCPQAVVIRAPHSNQPVPSTSPDQIQSPLRSPSPPPFAWVPSVWAEVHEAGGVGPAIWISALATLRLWCRLLEHTSKSPGESSLL